MANATYRDARAGFVIYLEHDGEIWRDALNETLQAHGYTPISKRMMTHYANLFRVGFNRYISINRFDVARASRAYDNMASLSRYKYRRVDQDVTVVFENRSTILETRGNLIESGDVGGIVEFSAVDSIEGLTEFNLRPKNRVALYFPDLQSEINGVVVASDRISRPMLVEIAYERLFSVSEIENLEPLPKDRVCFKLLSNEEETLIVDVIGRRFYYFFEFLEGIRALYNEVSGLSTDHRYAPPAVVSEISVASPATMVLQFSHELVDLIPWTRVFDYLSAIVTLKYAHRSSPRANKESPVDENSDTINSTGSDLIFEAEESIKQQENELTTEICRKTRVRIPGSSISDERTLRIIQQYIIGPCRELAGSDVHKIETTIDEDSDSDDSNSKEDL